ncbi:hypothetical protein [Jeotgalibacillus marinus]|uniref:ABC transporter periplasmic binding protein yphF n=1 Tax=Jeotgalibacillus marinus TaxID=86667 RepID=A0ABV3PYP9_9BACL
MKKYSAILAIICTVLLLTGCMYPAQQKSENELPYEDQIATVQQAIDQFQEESGGLLPIRTVEEDTPIYQKYLIDYSKLKPRYLKQLPGNAYENGGVFQYTLTNVEEDPTVRIFDLRIAETIRTLNVRIQANQGVPFKEALGDNVFTINYEKLGYKEDPMVLSPFTNKELPLVASGDGTIYVDYITDLYQIAQEQELTLEQSDEDIRSILLNGSMFVPAYSFPYAVNEENKIIYSNPS